MIFSDLLRLNSPNLRSRYASCGVSPGINKVPVLAPPSCPGDDHPHVLIGCEGTCRAERHYMCSIRRWCGVLPCPASKGKFGRAAESCCTPKLRLGLQHARGRLSWDSRHTLSVI